MTKLEFIEFLKTKQKQLGHTTHWEPTYNNSDEHWSLFRPSVDWLEDTINLSTEGVIKVSYGETFYDDPKIIDMSYEEFIENYDKSVSHL